MAGSTNRFKFEVFNWVFRGVALPTNFHIALVTSAVAPVADTNTLSDLTEIAAGNGYVAGGVALSRNATDFDSLVENDTDDRGEIQIKDIVYTAAGGPIPASGAGARYAVLTDDNVTVGSRKVLWHWDLVSDKSVSDTQALTLQDLTMRGKES